MHLSEDSHGLRVEADLDDDDPDTKMLTRKMARGDIDGASMSFIATKQAWSDDYTQRTIQEASLDRGDVAICNQGANPAAGSWRVGSTANGLADPPIAGSVSRSNQLTLQERRNMATQIGRVVRIECRDLRIDDGRGSSRAPRRPFAPQSTKGRNRRTIIPDVGIEERLALARARVRSGKVARSPATVTESRAYTQKDIDKLGAEGKAFKNPDGSFSYPIDTLSDLKNAIRAVGRGNANHKAIRLFIIGRARVWLH